MLPKNLAAKGAIFVAKVSRQKILAKKCSKKNSILRNAMAKIKTTKKVDR